MSQMFDFEVPSCDGLAFIPLSVRYHLDAGDRRISLAQWQALPMADRERLSDFPVPEAGHDAAATADCVACLDRALAAAGSAPALDEQSTASGTGVPGLGEDAPAAPESVCRQAALHGMAPPDEAAWRRLGRFQRYALLKLSRKDKPNHDFRAAMQEFGLG
ncbi:nitrate reductase associated protein [Chitinasiproducens palmae]|uniref:Nitrate reductase associated protein n=1 Tax=Chitinasiproducens palmae TaxID=1770053 RepID=A0A1H2PN99_9BURK|nr:nitrate reductase associated protein [Chitinasiproducens palmae]SDV48155.1 conserved hypothetical protein [Chitinasiproducens palmae]